MDLLYPINPGMLEVYFGPMRSGKSSEIIHRLSKIDFIPGAKYIAFKPLGDDRTPGRIYSRMGGGISIPAVEIPDDDPLKALEYICKDTDIVVFDETQFFNKDIVHLVEKLLDDDKNVIISGAQLDFRGEPFGMMPYFVMHANLLVPVTAICEYKKKDECGNIVYACDHRATLTQRLIDGKPANYDDPVKMTGDREGVENKSMSYEARCRKHHEVPGKPDL
jgi:thymidine kinase